MHDKIFTERFSWLESYRRKTKRLEDKLTSMAFFMSYMQADKVCDQWKTPISHDALLSLIYRKQMVKSLRPFVGIDYFAYKKNHCYGTFYDLDTHKPIDMLDNREVGNVQSWFEERPIIQVSTRDRSNTFQRTITNANPL